MRDIGTPKNIQFILDRFDLSAKKSLGQNFLKDPNILNKIVTQAQINSNSLVLEIGPGIGSLTEYLAKEAKHVYAFEIDQHLLPVLEYTLADYPNVTIFNQDILTADFDQLMRDYLEPEEPISVVANLPYYITTPIIMRLLKSPLPIERLVLMMQKEVADRLQAKPGTKAYGSLSLAVQYYAKVRPLFDVPRTVFTPQPNVDSVMIELMPYSDQPIASNDPEFLGELIRASFASRRKTLWNNLRAFYTDKSVHLQVKESLDEVSIDPGRRGETLTLEEFVHLADALTFRGLNQK